jgi:hypothetical protein
MSRLALAEFCADVGMLLRDEPRGTAARFADYMVAWWDGRRVVFAWLREDNPALIEEEFDPSDLQWDEWADAFLRWRTGPVFERFDEIEQWIRESPPHEAGHIE